jgi:hypothetical protein
MDRREQAVQEGEAFGGFQKPDQSRRAMAVLAAVIVGSQAIPKRTIGHTESPRDLSPRLPPKAELLGTFEDLHLAKTRTDPGFPAALRGRRLRAGIHGLGSFKGFPYHH